MRDTHLHSVIVQYKTLLIQSADTEFYIYIGKDRIYEPFVQLIEEKSRHVFLEAVENQSTDSFVVDVITRDNEIESIYMQIEFEPQHMVIELESVNELVMGQEFYRKLHNMNLDLLGLHNDIMFTYNDEKQCVKLYTPDFRRCTKTYTLEEFVSEIRGNMVETESDKLDELVISLKMKSGSFVHTFTGNIITASEDCKKSIVKGIAVRDVESIDVAGYIHRGSNKANASHIIEKDPLTGTYSKREIDNMARKAIDVEKQPNVAVCIIDIDYFKRVNDTFGHLKGDEVLKTVAEIIRSEVGSKGVVGRFGGDEFLVLLYDVEDMDQCRELLSSIKNRVKTTFPASEDNSSVTATLSIGCAVYPKDADNYVDIFNLADYCLYLAKDKGRNRYIIYRPELHGSVEEIHDQYTNNRRIDNRKNMAMGDVLCMIEDQHYNEASYTADMLVDDLVDNLSFERIICLSGKPLKCCCMSGINLPSEEVINECAMILGNAAYNDIFENDVIIIDNVQMLKSIDENIYNAYTRMNIKSIIMVRFLDAAGKPSLVSLEMTTASVAWNRNQVYNYRKIARMLAKYEL